MSLRKETRRVDVSDDNWGYDWIAHPSGGNANPASQELKDHRNEITVLWEIGDDDAGYSFDDWALIRYRKKLYLLETSGCSCPSPCEEWGIVVGPASAKEIRTYLKNQAEDPMGWSMLVRQKDEFAEAMRGVR